MAGIKDITLADRVEDRDIFGEDVRQQEAQVLCCSLNELGSPRFFAFTRQAQAGVVHNESYTSVIFLAFTNYLIIFREVEGFAVIPHPNNKLRLSIGITPALYEARAVDIASETISIVLM